MHPHLHVDRHPSCAQVPFAINKQVSATVHVHESTPCYLERLNASTSMLPYMLNAGNCCLKAVPR